MNTYRYTTQAAIRKAFWADYPMLSRKKIKIGDEKYYTTDTRCEFVMYIDRLERASDISSKLANRATL